MFEFIRKTLLTGAGLALVTAEKIEELVDELVQKGEITEQQGKALIDELIEKSGKAGAEFEARIKGWLREVVEKANLATREEVAELTARIERLEQQVGAEEGGEESPGEGTLA